jgi:hypothetical protein
MSTNHAMNTVVYNHPPIWSLNEWSLDDWRKAALNEWSLEDWREAANYANSYTRVGVLYNAMVDSSLARFEEFTLLGEQLTSCDNVWTLRSLLRQELRAASRAELDCMMDERERAALAALPERVPIYRGCYAINKTGLSWSTDRAIAERFPRLGRYSRPGETPLLRSGTTRRDRAVLKLNRNEFEIIAADVRVISTVVLPAEPKAAEHGVHEEIDLEP